MSGVEEDRQAPNENLGLMQSDEASPRSRPRASRVAVALIAVGTLGAVMLVSRHQPAAHQVVTQGAPNRNEPAAALSGDESAPTATAGRLGDATAGPATTAPTPARAPTTTSGPSLVGRRLMA